MQPGVAQNYPNNYNTAPQPYPSQSALTPQTQYQLAQGLALNENPVNAQGNPYYGGKKWYDDLNQRDAIKINRYN